MKPKSLLVALQCALLFSYTSYAQEPAYNLSQDPDVSAHIPKMLPSTYSTKSGLPDRDPNVMGYVAQYKTMAISEMQRAGVPASITMAQGIIESGAGKSDLAVNAKNHFGIKKGSNWNGPLYYVKDDDTDARGVLIPSPFRVYNRVEESYSDHSNFLRIGRRYDFLFTYNPVDYKSWAYGLVKAGYATDKRYGDMLTNTIEQYQLDQLDGGNGQNSNPSNGNNYGNNNNGNNNGNGNNGQYNGSANNGVNFAMTDQVQRNNNLKMVVSNGRSTLESIAGRYDVRLKDLLDYNENIGATDALLPVSSIVYLEKKARNWHGDNKYYTVKPNDKMFDIAQMYGIRLSNLYSKNNMRPGDEPAFGERVILRRGWFQGWQTPRLRDPSRDPQQQQPIQPNPANGQYNPSNPNNVGGYNNQNGNNNPYNNNPNHNNPNGSQPVPTGATNPDGTLNIDITPGSAQSPYPSSPTPLPSNNYDPPRQPTYNPPSQPSYNPPPMPSQTNGAAQYYTVKPKETLYGISRQFNTTVDELKRLNSLNDTGLRIGQQLRVR